MGFSKGGWFNTVAEDAGGAHLIVRFSPFTAEGIEKNANATVAHDRMNNRVPPRYGVSAFGCVQQPDESVDEAIFRICEVANKNGRKVAVLTADQLDAAGLVAHWDEPPPMHHLVGSSTLESPPDYNLLSELLNENRRDNPVKKDGRSL